MAYSIKVQKITQPTCTSYYANIPTAVVETMQIEKGEQMEWNLEDRDTLILRRKIGSSTFSVVLAQYPLLRRRNLSTYFERYYRNV